MTSMSDRALDESILAKILDCPDISDETKFAHAQAHQLRRAYRDAVGELGERTAYLMGWVIPPAHPWARVFEAQVWSRGALRLYGADVFVFLLLHLRDQQARDDADGVPGHPVGLAPDGWAPPAKPAMSGAEAAYRAAMAQPATTAAAIDARAALMLDATREICRIPGPPDEETRAADDRWRSWVDEHVKCLVMDLAAAPVLQDEGALAGLARAHDEHLRERVEGFRRINRERPDLVAYAALSAAWGLRKRALNRRMLEESGR